MTWFVLVVVAALSAATAARPHDHGEDNMLRSLVEGKKENFGEDGARATRTRGRRFISLDDGNIKAAADEWVADADSARMDYGPIADWDVGRVTDMTSMFESATTFNSDLSKWQMSGVETLTRMFVGATNFKQDLGDWKFHDTVVGVADMLVNSGSEDRCEFEIAGDKPGGRATIHSRFYCNTVTTLKDGEQCTSSTLPCDSGKCRTHCCPREFFRAYTGAEQCNERGEIVLLESTFKLDLSTNRVYDGNPLIEVFTVGETISVITGVPVIISPLKLMSATTYPWPGTIEDVTYTFELKKSPKDEKRKLFFYSFFIAASSGVMSLTFAKEGMYVIDMIAVEGVSSTTQVMETLTFQVETPVVPPDNTTIIVLGVVGGMLIMFAVLAWWGHGYLMDPIRLASKRKNDPLSKIGEYIEDNRQSLRESVVGTIVCKRRFDEEFQATCIKDFHNDVSNPGLLDTLRNVHARVKAGVETRVNANQTLIQSTLKFDLEDDLNGLEHDTVRIATQKKYLADLYKVMTAEEPTAYALLQGITHDLLAKNPTLSTKEIELHRGPLKQMDRILEKADLKKFHFEEVRDYGRASWIVDSVARLPALLQRLEDGNEFDIVRCKNRYDPSYNSQRSGGYRDYQLVLRTRVGSESLATASSPAAAKLNPISCEWLYELQIMTKGFHALKMGTGGDTDALAAHEAYKNFRKFNELSDRIATQAAEMKEELAFDTVDNTQGITLTDVAKPVIMKKKSKSSNKVGPE